MVGKVARATSGSTCTALFPVVVGTETSTTHPVFVDDLPLVHSVGVFEEAALCSGMVTVEVVGETPTALIVC